MYQEAPVAITEGLTPFEVDGTFNIQKAMNLASEQRELGYMVAADALELLADFFITSESYILDGINSLSQDICSAGSHPSTMDVQT